MRKTMIFVLLALLLAQCTTQRPEGQKLQPTHLASPTTGALFEATSTHPPADTPTPAQPSPTPETEAQPTPTRQRSAIQPALQVDTSQPVSGANLVPWEPGTYRAEIDQLPVTMEKITNPEVLAGLTEEQREFVSKNGFVVIDTGDRQFSDIRFQVAKEQGQPYYLTTDAAYHALHLTFDEFLKALEREQFRPQMIVLTETLLNQVQAYRQDLKGTPLEADAEQAEAYLAVALKLFDPEAGLSSDLEKRIAPQLAQIQAAAGRDRSALFPNFEDDYGAYKPVGHYAASPALENYFRGMTWYGRVAIALHDPNNPDFQPTRLPLIVTLALRQAGADTSFPASEQWAGLHRSLTYLIGPSDDSGPLELSTLMDQVYGAEITVQDLVDDSLWQQFLDRVDELPAPQINSTFVQTTAELQASRDWRLMGQRFTLDGMIFQNLIYDKVGDETNKRKFPSGLDVMAVFGSQAAYQAQEAAGETKYQHYPEQVQKLQAAVEAQPESEWFNRFYSSWLYTFLPQVAPKTEAYPPYMRTAAWDYKDLNTALGSWAELKHDTVLYTKMPEFMGGGGPPSSGPAPAYVEPNPMVFYRLTYLTESLFWSGMGIMASGSSSDIPEQESALGLEQLHNSLESLAEQFRHLGDIAAKELAGEPLEESDLWAIQSCLGPLECLPEAQDPPEEIPVIAAVSGAEGDVLEAGVGYLDRIYVAVPIDGQLQVAQGGVFTYYEFTQPREQRLTDQEWRKRLETAPPQRPAYTREYVRTGGSAAFSLAFRVGDVYLITEAGGNPPLNLRAEPSKNAAIVEKLKTGEYILIKDGPVQANGMTWWQIEIPYNEKVTGWVAENPDWYARAHGQ